MNKKLILLTTVTIVFSGSASAETLREKVNRLEKRLDQIETPANSSKTSWLKNYKVFGRIHYDKTIQLNGDETGEENSSKLRRARLGMSGNLIDDWSFKLQYDFSEGDAEPRKPGIKDAFLKKSFGNSYALIGQFKEPFSLEELASSNNFVFIERGNSHNIIPSRRMGLAYGYNGKNWTIVSGIFGDNANKFSKNDQKSGDESITSTTRVSFAPINSKETQLHLAAAYRFSDPHNKDNVIANTVGGRVKNVQMIGLEAAFQSHGLKVQGELYNRDVEIESTSYAKSNTGYVQASYVLTGESRSYKNGVFKSIKPKGKNGAWEIAYRYSEDLESTADPKEAAVEHTYGLNWHTNNNVRFSANYVETDSESSVQNAQKLVFRAKVNF